MMRLPEAARGLRDRRHVLEVFGQSRAKERGCPDLVILHQCVAEHQPEWGRSWLNVRGDQKYRAELNCEEQTQLNAVRHARLRKQKRLPGPSPNARQ